MSDVSTTASAMTGAGGGDKIRLLGMQSGLDVDATVKKMLSGEQSKLDKAQQQQQTIQWKQEAYQDIIKDVKALQSTVFDTNSSDNYILGSKNFAPFTITSASGAATVDTSVATFEPQAGAQTGKYSITVSQLASGGGISNAIINTSSGAKATLSTKLTDIDPSLINGINLSLNVSGTTDPINIMLNNPNTATSRTATYDATLGDLVNAINNQSGGRVKAVYSELTGEFKLNNISTGSDSTLTINAGTTGNLSRILGTGNITLAAGVGISNSAPIMKTDPTTTKLTDINSSLTGSIILKLNDGSGVTTVTLDNSSGNATVKNLVDAINTQAGSKFAASCNTTDGFKLTANTGSLSVVSGTNPGLLSVFSLTNNAFGSTGAASTTSDITLAAGAGISNQVKTSLNATATNNTTLADINSAINSSSDPIKLVLNTGGSNITIALNKTDSLDTICNTINNSAAGTSVTASVTTGGVFQLTPKESTTTIKIASGTTSGLFDVLGLTTGAGTAQTGQNAHVTITPPGGSAVTLADDSSSSLTKNNDFTIDGMNYTLSSTGTTSVNVGSDTSKVYDKITDFISKYNTIIDKIQGRLTEKKDKNYAPLTDSQKSSMSETQITAWETKAKVGILRNDDNLQNMLNDLRSAFNSVVANTSLKFGQYGSNAIGIDFSNDPTEPGHIEIADSAKLKAAIANYPDQIAKMFTNQSTKTDGKTKYTMDTNEYQEDGIFKRVKTIFENNVGFVNTSLNTATLTIYANKQYDYSMTGTQGKGTIPDQLYEQQLMVKKVKDEMSTLQERYYKQFSALETAMTTLNAQQSQLSSMLGS